MFTIHKHALWCGMLLCSGCVQSPEPSGPPFRAYVIDQTDVDAESGRGQFEVTQRELTRITQLSTLDGPDYQIVRGGALETHVLGGSVVVEGAFSGGEPAEPRYRLVNGSIIARDYTSLMMLSAARQFERVFDALDARGPYSAQMLFAKHGRPRVYFEPTIELTGSESATATLKFNAFFDPTRSAFGLARRSDVEDVPIAADFKVIAHEVGHAVFFLAFDGAERESCQASDGNRAQRWFPGRLDYEYVMHGLNEGFADWHSFSITGSVDGLANQSAITVQRNIRDPGFRFDDLVRYGIPSAPEDVSGMPGHCSDGFYCIGTLFASSLYAAYVAMGADPGDADARATFTAQLVRALEQTKAALRDGAQLPLPTKDVAACELSDDFNAPHDAAMVSAFLGALLPQFDADVRATLCEALDHAFGSLAFLPPARAGCEP
jgi:hypothetical protein